jgi:hypothetical protein
VPCYVTEAGDLIQQADSFVAINSDRVRIGTLQLYHSRLVAGDPEAVRIASVLAEAGVQMARTNIMSSKIPPLMTLAVSAITDLVGRHEEAPVVDALKVLAEAFPETGGQIRATGIKALTHLFVACPDFDLDWGRLVRTVSDLDMEELEQAARASRQFFNGQAHRAMAAAIARSYNKCRRDPAKRLPETL